MCISSLSQMSHSACTLGQLVKQSQKPCLDGQAQKQIRGREALRKSVTGKLHQTLTLLSPNSTLRPKTAAEKDKGITHTTQITHGVRAKTVPVNLRLKKHFNINMDIFPCVTFQKISWTNHCKPTKTV